MITIAICDDHPLVREGFKHMLSEVSDMTVVAEAVNGREALDIARKRICDVILLDISMPDQNGVDALRTIKQGQPDFPILILTGYPAQQFAVSLFKMGANGYLNKDCPATELIKAIRTVATGRRYVSEEVGEILAQGFGHDTSMAPHAELSDREFQIFLRLAKGESSSDISAALSLSGKTISTYRSRLMDKMNMRSNSELTYYALKNNLMD